MLERTSPPVPVVLVDDDAAIRHLVHLHAQRTPQLVIVGEAADGVEALTVVSEVQPAVVLLDLLMPTGGLEVLPTMAAAAPTTRILAWSAEPDQLTQARHAGAHDTVDKTVPWSDIVGRIVALAGDADVGAEPEARHVRLHRDQVEVLEAWPFTTPVAAGASWPCPGCGSRRPLAGATHLQVRNRVGDPLRRTVVICAVCVEAFGARSAAVGTADGPSGPPGIRGA